MKEMSEKQINTENSEEIKVIRPEEKIEITHKVVIPQNTKKVPKRLLRSLGDTEKKVETPVKVEKTKKEKVNIVIHLNTDGAWDD